MKRIFINYSWEHDTHNAEKLYEALSLFPEKFNLWMDSKNLEGGLQWRPAIRKAIREADYFVAVLSPGSVNKRGYINKELYQAIDILQEFPPNQTYLIPARVKNCNSPFEDLAKLNYVDLFPNWDQGMEKLVKALDKSLSLNKANKSPIKKASASRKKYHYRIGLVDIDHGFTNLKKVVTQLNNTQSYFQFTLPEMESLKNKTVMIDGIKNFNVEKVSGAYIKRNLNLDTDFVVCLTKYPLSFEENEEVHSNYFSVSSDYNERFMFVSSDQLTEFSSSARIKFEEGMLYMLIGQLIAYFTDTDFHDETRGCVLDFCEIREDIAKGFKKRKLCTSCNKKLAAGELKEAVTLLLKWQYK